MTITLFHYMSLSIIVFLIGIFGILLNRKSVISLIMSIEVILISININFVAFANYWGNFTGYVFVIYVLAISAAEIAIVLSALILYFNNKSNIWVDDLTQLKG